jgi:4a-hydroxytetrahydrobiopterin dehydratase
MSSHNTQAVNVLTEAQIATRLPQELPRWSFTNGHIERVFKTAGWKATLMVVNAIGHLAEVAWHHPDLAVSYARVTVRLMTHDAGGITDKDFELARKIEEVVMWRPGQQPGSALEGTPDDERYACVIGD